jgi:trans-L-3-hydroxyproline dehydratase
VGTVRFDVAYGGAFYAFVEAAPLGLSLTSNDYSRLMIKDAGSKTRSRESFMIKHPFEDDLSFLYGTIFTDPRLSQAITVEMFASLLRRS